MTVSSASLVWRGDALCWRGREQARIVPDQTYPGMWRVRLPDRPLTDMLNRTRARDAARALVLANLNTEETPSEAPQRGVSPSPGSTPHGGVTRPVVNAPEASP
jgi:hypothetical protein